MARMHVKRNDLVTVISGAEKGKSGRVLAVDRAKARVTVEGCNVRRKTVRRSPENPQGGIIEVEGAIHISNVMLQEKYDGRRAKAGKPEVADAGASADNAEASQDEVQQS